MSAPTERAQLHALTRVLLDAGATSAARQQAATGLYDLAGRLAQWHPEAAPEEGTQLDHGLAIDPSAAARCCLDATRTARFLQAVQSAVDSAASRSHAPVRVLYAGCGPLAPLALPLVSVWPPERLRLTLLDVHAAATRHLQLLVRALDAGAWIETLATQDALAWHAPQPPHVIVVECLQQALTREPQVALMRHLAPQLAPGGTFVPQSIRLDAGLADLRRELGACLEDERAPLADATRPVRLGTFFEVSAAALQRGEPLSLQAQQYRVPVEDGAARHVLVRTHVQLDERLGLADGESGITQPLVIHALGRVAPGARLEFSYEAGRNPGPRCRLAR